MSKVIKPPETSEAPEASEASTMTWSEIFCDKLREVYRAKGLPEKANWLEPHNTLAVKRIVRKGWTCINVGANKGWFTLLSAFIAGPKGRVVAFEPALVSTLQHNIETVTRKYPKKIAEITMVAAALGDKVETRRVYRRTPGWTLYRDPRDGSTAVDIAFTTLDAWWAEPGKKTRLDFVFVDIDGSEVRFLRGARSVLKAFTPILAIEIGHPGNLQGGSHAEAARILKSCGYTRFESARRRPLDFKRLGVKKGSGVTVFCYP